MIIAIDGPAGSGKTTTARKVAQNLGFIHINTGAMYRGIALKIIREKVNLNDKIAIEKVLNNTHFDFTGQDNGTLIMDNEDISAEIYSSKVNDNVSKISAISAVRMKLVEYQRLISRGHNVVLEGRDIGTVVFPNADYKFYLVADINVRAERRKNERDAAGDYMTIKEIIHLLKDRDYQDSSRENSPLLKAKDAVELDTTYLNIEEQVNYIINTVNFKQEGV